MISMDNRYNRVAENILANVEEVINEMEAEKAALPFVRVRREIRPLCGFLSIFDWFNGELSLSQLKQMRSFLKSAISTGYTGYVCFKVGSTGTASGMWAYKVPTSTGYAPDGACLYRTFQSRLNWWDAFDEFEWVTAKTGKTRGEFVRFTDIKPYL